MLDLILGLLLCAAFGAALYFSIKQRGRCSCAGGCTGGCASCQSSGSSAGSKAAALKDSQIRCLKCRR